MTEPTELSRLRHLYQNMVNGAVRDTASAKRIAEGLLAPAIEALERGTPPAVAGEPVAWRYRPSAVWDDYVLTDDPGKAARARANGLHVEALCLTTPQPTQAQAGAVPPTNARLQDISLNYSDSEDECTGFRDGWRAAKKHHGIKGGRHVGKVD